MPLRLVGANTRFMNGTTGLSLMGKIISATERTITVRFEENMESAIGTDLNLITFANSNEYTAQVKIVGATYKKAVMQVTSAVSEMPMSEDIKLLSQPFETACRAADKYFPIVIVAANDEAFAFESTDILPMEENLNLIVDTGHSQLPVPSELILQRYQAGAYRCLARIQSMERLAKMHWHRILSA